MDPETLDYINTAPTTQPRRINTMTTQELQRLQTQIDTDTLNHITANNIIEEELTKRGIYRPGDNRQKTTTPQ